MSPEATKLFHKFLHRSLCLRHAECVTTHKTIHDRMLALPEIEPSILRERCEIRNNVVKEILEFAGFVEAGADLSTLDARCPSFPAIRELLEYIDDYRERYDPIGLTERHTLATIIIHINEHLSTELSENRSASRN